MHNELSCEVHPTGEDDFVFSTAGGKVALRATDDALTPYGGLVPWAAFAKHTGVFEALAATCPVVRTSPNLGGLRRAAQLRVDRSDRRAALRPRAALARGSEPGGIVRRRVDSQRRFDPAIVRHHRRGGGPALGRGGSAPLWGALPERVILDWDSTVQTKYGHQEGRRAATIRKSRAAKVSIR
jgi:hypothetical protein